MTPDKPVTKTSVTTKTEPAIISDLPKTGDTSHVPGYSLLAFASMAALTGLRRIRRKR